MNDRSLKVGKIEYRIEFFRDAYKVLLTVSGGSVIAIVTFFQSLHSEIGGRAYFIWGLTCLLLAILSQLIMPLLNVIGSGFYWDAMNHKRDQDWKASQAYGHLSGGVLILGTLSTMVGVILLSLFVLANV